MLFLCFTALQSSIKSDYISNIRVDKAYRKNIGTSFSRFQQEKKFWDCKIIVGTETLYCHSVIISALSTVLEEMIETKIRDGVEKEITFDDIQPEVMRKITNYMYTGCVIIPKELVLEVVQVCDELEIEDLKARCVYRVPDILSPQTAIGWMRYAHKHALLSILDLCKRYVSDSFLEVTKEKEFIRLSLDDLSITLELLNDTVSPENLLTSVLSWINYDKMSRKKALDYTSGYLELKMCKTQFLSESAKEHIDIFRCNPEFNKRVTRMLRPRKLSMVVIGGAIFRHRGVVDRNTKVWTLESETKFEDILSTPNGLICGYPSICRYDGNKLIVTGTYGSNGCAMLDLPTKKWKKMRRRRMINRQVHVSACIFQQLIAFGGVISIGDDPIKWTASVECLHMQQEHGEWQRAPPMPSVLEFPRLAELDTSVCLMGYANPVLYVFDVLKKICSQKTPMPQNPGRNFSIAAGNGNLYAAGGMLEACWQYMFSSDSWAKLSPPLLLHVDARLIFHQKSLLLLGGFKEDHIEGYAIEKDIWVMAPYKLPEKLYNPHVFMMDLGK